MMLLMGAVAFAAAAVVAGDTNAGAKSDDRVICKKDRSYQTGSHMRRPPVCKLKSAWNLEEKEAQRRLQQIRDRGPRTQTPAPTACSGGPG